MLHFQSAFAARPRSLIPRLHWSLGFLALPVAVGMPFALYVATLAPTVYNLDSAELATAGATLGIAHPPGYPLYVFLARLFILLPFGDIGYRVNLMSAAFAAVALTFVFLLSLRVTHSRVAAIAGTWLLGVAYPFWSDAIVAEVYTLDAALLAAMLFFLVRGHDMHRDRDSTLGFAMLGLGIANRVTSGLALPGVVLFRASDWRQRPRRMLIDLAAMLPGIALYGWLPLRSAIGGGYRWGSTYTDDAVPIPIDITTPYQLWWYASARAFAPFQHMYSWREQLDQAQQFGDNAWAALLGGGVILAVAGFLALATRRPHVAALLLTVGLPQTLFYINYGTYDKDTMFANTYLIVAILAACGYAWAEHALRTYRVPGAPALLAATAALCIGALIYTNAGLLDVSDDYRARDEGHQLMFAADPNAIVVGSWTDIAPLEHMQLAEHLRPDLRLVQGWAFSWIGPSDLVTHNLDQGRSVYVTDLTGVNTTGVEVFRVGRWYGLKIVSR